MARVKLLDPEEAAGWTDAEIVEKRAMDGVGISCGVPLDRRDG